MEQSPKHAGLRSPKYAELKIDPNAPPRPPSGAISSASENPNLPTSNNNSPSLLGVSPLPGPALTSPTEFLNPPILSPKTGMVSSFFRLGTPLRERPPVSPMRPNPSPRPPSAGSMPASFDETLFRIQPRPDLRVGSVESERITSNSRPYTPQRPPALQRPAHGRSQSETGMKWLAPSSPSPKSKPSMSEEDLKECMRKIKEEFASICMAFQKILLKDQQPAEVFEQHIEEKTASELSLELRREALKSRAVETSLEIYKSSINHCNESLEIDITKIEQEKVSPLEEKINNLNKRIESLSKVQDELLIIENIMRLYEEENVFLTFCNNFEDANLQKEQIIIDREKILQSLHEQYDLRRNSLLEISHKIVFNAEELENIIEMGQGTRKEKQQEYINLLESIRQLEEKTREIELSCSTRSLNRILSPGPFSRIKESCQQLTPLFLAKKDEISKHHQLKTRALELNNEQFENQLRQEAQHKLDTKAEVLKQEAVIKLEERFIRAVDSLESRCQIPELLSNLKNKKQEKMDGLWNAQAEKKLKPYRDNFSSMHSDNEGLKSLQEAFSYWYDSYVLHINTSLKERNIPHDRRKQILLLIQKPRGIFQGDIGKRIEELEEAAQHTAQEPPQSAVAVAVTVAVVAEEEKTSSPLSSAPIPFPSVLHSQNTPTSEKEEEEKKSSPLPSPAILHSSNTPKYNWKIAAFWFVVLSITGYLFFTPYWFCGLPIVAYFLYESYGHFGQWYLSEKKNNSTQNEAAEISFSDRVIRVGLDPRPTETLANLAQHAEFKEDSTRFDMFPPALDSQQEHSKTQAKRVRSGRDSLPQPI